MKDFSLKKKIKNKDYTVFIEGMEFKINFYDYIFKDLIFELLRVKDVPENEKKLFILNALNDPKFWTIQKYIKVNNLYNDDHLNDLFNEDMDTMLKHKVLEKVFNKVKMFDNYNYPFLIQEFLKQIHNNIVYIKLPTKLILGLTLKRIGIVVINKGRFEHIINEQLDKNSKFILKLAECAFYKITIVHEINFHYFLIILYSNKKVDILTTPEKVFKNENNIKEKLDFGDKGETALFGTKISVLYIKAIMDILTLNSWNQYQNKELEIIKDVFFNLNKNVNTNDIKIEDLIHLNNFTEYLHKLLEKEKDIEPFCLNIGVGNIFSNGKILNLKPDQIDLNCDFGKILPRGICLNACRYYFS